jgi:hypothetical protein
MGDLEGDAQARGCSRRRHLPDLAANAAGSWAYSKRVGSEEHDALELDERY